MIEAVRGVVGLFRRVAFAKMNGRAKELTREQGELQRYYADILTPHIKNVVKKWATRWSEIQYSVMPLASEVQVTFWLVVSNAHSDEKVEMPLTEEQMEAIKARIVRFRGKRVEHKTPLMVKRCGTNIVRYCWSVSLDRRQRPR